MTRADARQRPFGVTAIAVLLLLNGLVGLVPLGREAREIYLEHRTDVQVETVLQASEDFSAMEWLTLPFNIAGLAVAWGLWTLRPKAWTVTMFLQGLYLMIQIYDYFQGEPVHLNLLLSVVTVLYLNQSDVQLVFRREHAPDQQEALLS